MVRFMTHWFEWFSLSPRSSEVPGSNLPVCWSLGSLCVGCACSLRVVGCSSFLPQFEIQEVKSIVNSKLPVCVNALIVPRVLTLRSTGDPSGSEHAGISFSSWQS